MKHSLLVLNAGSSSIKFGVFVVDGEAALRVDCEGHIQGLGYHPTLQIVSPEGDVLHRQDWSAAVDHDAVLQPVLAWLDARLAHRHPLAGAAHRVVHGGAKLTRPCRITPDILDALRALIPLAPLHQPHHITAIEAIARLHPDLPQVACFDTAFHQTQNNLATAFAIPRRLSDQGIRRYGFHGLSYEYVTRALPGLVGRTAAQGRLIIAHLGSGASLCAVAHGRSVATTMGFTALDGIPMSQRCGNIDPGVVLYLMQHDGMTIDQVAHLLYHDCGLKGVSGISGDMHDLLDSPSADAAAAIDLFVYRIGREIGSLTAALGGLDTLVFTAGIGEHSPVIRERVAAQAAWLGLRLDHAANRASRVNRGAQCISLPDSSVTAWVIPTHEDQMIARHAAEVLGIRCFR
jgi:acetate kinase